MNRNHARASDEKSARQKTIRDSLIVANLFLPRDASTVFFHRCYLAGSGFCSGMNLHIPKKSGSRESAEKIRKMKQKNKIEHKNK